MVDPNRSADRKLSGLPLVIGLEDGLLNQSLLVEALWQQIRRKPWLIFKLPFDILTKRHIDLAIEGIRRGEVVPAIRQEVVTALAQNAPEGYYVLCRASHVPLSEKLIDRLPGAKGVIWALDDPKIQSGYRYITQNPRVTPWIPAKERICLVGAQGSRPAFSAEDQVTLWLLPKGQGFGSALLKALRPHQWVKSFLVFGPVLLWQRPVALESLLLALQAFFAFAMVSSSTYVLNDLFDLEGDRYHPKNKFRPFASGALPLMAGPFLYAMLLTVGLAGARLIGANEFFLLLGYAGINLGYSFGLKKIPLIDTFILATLYVSRFLMGALAVGMSFALSFYGFLVAFFLNLAFLKRVTELHLKEQERSASRRGYEFEDRHPLMTMGIASGFVGAAIYWQFLGDVGFQDRWGLWTIGGIFLIWFCYLWLLCWRGKMDTDPVKFALKDPISLVCGSLCALLWIQFGP